MSLRQAINKSGQIGWTNGDGSRWYSDWLAASTAELAPAFRAQESPHNWNTEVDIDFDNPTHRPRLEELAKKLGISPDGSSG